METRRVNADDVRSAILNCICPECGGVIELETSELRCLGRCGKRWRDIWVRTQLHLQARKARRSSSPRRETGVDRVNEQISLRGSNVGYDNQRANRKSYRGIASCHKGR